LPYNLSLSRAIITTGVNMKAVILVGGFGTRLIPLTINTPKAMMPVLNTPFLEYVIRRLAYHNIKEIVLAISHLAQPIKNYFGDGSRLGASLSYTIEETALGTAGAVKNAEKYLDGAFLALNGDIFTDLDLTAMMDFHRRSQSLATIALTPVENPTIYGLVETDDSGRVTRFLEKPGWEDVTTNMINAGTYILEPEVLSSIPPQTNFSFEHEVFPPLLEQGGHIYAFPSSCYWMDIGTPEKYRQLNLDLLDGKSNQYRPDIITGISVGERSQCHPTTEITAPVVIGNNCSIGRNAHLTGPLIIGTGSTIADSAVVDDSIIWHRVTIEAGATVRQSIIANDCRLGAGSIVEGSVIPDNVTVTDGYHMAAGSRIQPGTAVG
jgi:mannose-1-phosphate guanylyltransferase